MKTSDTLITIAEEIEADPSILYAGDFARDAEGSRVDATDPTATRWCSFGLLQKHGLGCHSNSRDIRPWGRWLPEAMKIHGATHASAGYSDDLVREGKQLEVAKIFRLAADIAREEEVSCEN